MPSLKEIKGRIGSVKNTLKITSAMKLVASAKLKRAQTAIGNMVPYQEKLNSILVDLLGTSSNKPAGNTSVFTAQRKVERIAIVCFSSSSSLCGGFNANAIRKSKEVIDSYLEKGISKEKLFIYAVGKKMAKSLTNAGYSVSTDYADFNGSPDFDFAKRIAIRLTEDFVEGKVDRVELVYNHFASTGSQPTWHETYLPLSLEGLGGQEEGSRKPDHREDFYIIEPNREELIETLLPKVLKMKIYTVLLDTSAAEHAARTVAMQIATDNGNELLDDLTLEYNKTRQQRITSELLDILGGSVE